MADKASNGGWDQSAEAWILRQGATGDWSRRSVLDPVMLERIQSLELGRVLDVGCGEGRFCRLLSGLGWEVVGIDPTKRLIEQASKLDSQSSYMEAAAEELPFEDGSFELVVSYVSLIDIPDYQRAISEMSRVLKPGGTLLVANLNGFNTAGQSIGWIKDRLGRRLYYPMTDYLTERGEEVAWAGIRVLNWHRPLSAYMQEFLGCGLRLTYFSEPAASDGTARSVTFNKSPYFVVMEWRKDKA